jgi:hypothetical protein
MFDTLICEDLEQVPPGTELAVVLASLPWDKLSGHDLVRALQAQERQVAHYQAGAVWTTERIVAEYEEVASERILDLAEAAKGAAAEIGAALRLTRRSAEYRTSFAMFLQRRLPVVFEALLFGRIDMARAQVFVDCTLHLADAAAQAVADTLIEDAPLLTTGQLRHRLQKLCVDIDPDDARKRFESAVDDRRLVLEANNSGTANLLGLDLPPHVAASVKRWINEQAKRLRRLGDDRTMDQLRADIYLDLLRRRQTRTYKDDRPVDGGVHLTSDIDSLTGNSDKAGEIAGYGPVIADIARQVAEDQHDTEWTWEGIDPETGRPVVGGTTRRRPSTAQARKVRILHKTCVHPGCRMPAVDCDIDHRIPWASRQVTCIGALAPLCRHHHVVRHTWGWNYRPTAGGDFCFTSPLRHRYTTSGRPP